MEETLSEWLFTSSQQEFTIIIAGRISGGPLEDAMHRPIAFQISDNELIIEFERAEHLIVSNPSDISLEPNDCLVIRDGSEVRFTWYCYGHPPQPENLCEEIYWKVGKYMAFQRRVPPFTIFEPVPAVGPVGGPGITLVRLVKSERAF